MEKYNGIYISYRFRNKFLKNYNALCLLGAYLLEYIARLSAGLVPGEPILVTDTEMCEKYKIPRCRITKDKKWLSDNGFLFSENKNISFNFEKMSFEKKDEQNFYLDAKEE